ncbi:MAG: MFS transporter [Chloroflexota bacterium]
MSTAKQEPERRRPPYRYLFQRRISAIDHRRPQRWNWAVLVRPLDHSLVRSAPQPLERQHLRGLRYFWLDGLFSAISDNFYLGFITLFALAYGASNSQIGTLTAVANLLGALSFLPGARLVERIGRRKSVVVWTGGGFGRLALLALALLPFVVSRPEWAILAIIALNGLRAFLANLGNPAWTAIVADLVPELMRGRYFGSRNMAMGVAALAVAPLAGRLIALLNGQGGRPVLGYQAAFFLAFAFGLVATASYQRMPEPQAAVKTVTTTAKGGWRQALGLQPAFVGLVISAFIWNLSLQVAAPFFNVYLVKNLGATTALVGLVASISSLTALVGQRVFGRLLDSRGAIWVQRLTGLLIPGLPLAWIFISEPWHVGIINTFGGFLWAGYNLANFNLLLEMTPEAQRPRAVAVYQTVVFVSAVLGPLLGGYLADSVSFKLIFGLSGGGRLLGTLVFLWLTLRRKDEG